MTGLPDYVLRNRTNWDDAATEYEAPGRHLWAGEPRWGVFGVPEEHLGVLPDDVSGRDVLEVGCGTGYVSGWLARRGARPVGIDNSPRQLANAVMFQDEFGVGFPLVVGAAEMLPFPESSFDLVISEYGASLWSDPYSWIPEASRVLRPGGELIFLTNSALVVLCVYDDDSRPSDNVLKRDYFGMHRIEWPDDAGVEFHLGHGDWIRLLRANSFEITDLIEVQAPEGATTRYAWASAAWSRRWPVEEVWKAKKA